MYHIYQLVVLVKRSTNVYVITFRSKTHSFNISTLATRIIDDLCKQSEYNIIMGANTYDKNKQHCTTKYSVTYKHIDLSTSID